MSSQDIENIYSTKAYGETFSLPAGSKFEIFTSDKGTFQIPLVVRELENGIYTAQSPYGYPGIVANPGIEHKQHLSEWEDFIHRFKADGIIHLKIKLPPFNSSQAETLSPFPFVNIHNVGETIFVPRYSSADDNWRAMEGRARTSVRKAQNNHLRADISTYSAEDTLPSSEFRRLYENTMSRKEANSFYFFDDYYFQKLGTNLNQQILKIIVRDGKGLAVAGCLVLVDNFAAHYHLSGSTFEGARLGANNLMLWTLIEFVSNSTLSGSHLGGGMQKDDPLYKFKKSFGGISLPFQIASIVTNEIMYRNLTLKRAEQLKLSLSQIQAAGYFPAFETPDNFAEIYVN
ncbi:GNAT family N-acetyltransferase [Aurantimicrobium minutum]|uniref:GNAT family N-acetyltransferase n=1 Tax=Aurantimicrobium minutum TaxID=708131 RepID=UPI002474C12D|nr:GNAT family N-acetyltransferase [Aurantimicrobium minutum]MDH6256021.1 hypothetical protein [Aurantimicrobium minutum]